MKCVLGGMEKNAAGARNGETAQASRSSRNRHGKVEGEEGFAAFGLATDDADSFLGAQRSDEPTWFVGALRDAVSGFDRQQAHRRRPPAALDSAGGEQVSRNSFSSILPRLLLGCDREQFAGHVEACERVGALGAHLLVAFWVFAGSVLAGSRRVPAQLPTRSCVRNCGAA
jgi:hypothetical protein